MNAPSGQIVTSIFSYTSASSRPTRLVIYVLAIRSATPRPKLQGFTEEPDAKTDTPIAPSPAVLVVCSQLRRTARLN